MHDAAAVYAGGECTGESSLRTNPSIPSDCSVRYFTRPLQRVHDVKAVAGRARAAYRLAI